ncbi:MAG: hypothetical protein LUQ11_01060 [Methylococcaceae bacterium]|nr:hypothetical protein [Methylococcaceae bacterium]
MLTRKFLRTKIKALTARARRLASIDGEGVGIRPQDRPFAPSRAHFRAANQRLANIDRQVAQRLGRLEQTWQSAPKQRVLIEIALVEREIDRARRAFGLFFEIFSQRGSAFAPALSAHDVIAEDCYRAVREAAPQIFSAPLLKPLCYMEHGFSPATMRRGVLLNRLLGEPNPFPIVRIPWDRDTPWQAVFLHEVSHNLQADLGIWQENRQAVVRRTLRASGDPGLTRIYGLWHKEIFADLAAILLGGPAAAWGMATFLANPAPRTMTFRPGGAHPTAYLRVHILAEMLRRLGFDQDASRLSRVWDDLYNPRRVNRLPARLLSTSSRLIPEVVDEIAFQTRRNLAQRSLADIIVFDREHEQAILSGARSLGRGQMPHDLAPRHLVSAASYALAEGRIAPRLLADRVIDRLNELKNLAASMQRQTLSPIAA